MIGGSYVGQTQWFAASGAPRALKAIVPTVSPPGHPFTNEPFYGGALLLAMVEWMVAMGRRSSQVPGLLGILTEHQDYFEPMPVATMDEAGEPSNTMTGRIGVRMETATGHSARNVGTWMRS